MDQVENGSLGGVPLVRAAAYVRMSTEHQQYSTLNQADKIHEYAKQRGIQIVKTYADDGKSGLTLSGRLSLQRLIQDVQSGAADFKVILVYDITRWGRFQDADESAYYEYICKRAGIQVAYCAEQFENDGSPVATIVKSVKRAMAGEYSRELSVKVFAGQCRLIELGFRQGGMSGYGFKRVLLNEAGEAKAELKFGERKNLHTDRVVLRRGSEVEVRVVNQIYDWFVNEESSQTGIANKLNSMGIKPSVRQVWNRAMVHEVLTNEKYIGSNVYNRRSFKLKKLHVRNDPAMWIRKEGAFDAIVSRDLFYKSQAIINANARRFTDNEMIDRLRALFQHRGFLSGVIIDETEDMPSSSAYSHRFGSLRRAYHLVGFASDRDYGFIDTNRVLRQMHPEIVAQTEAEVRRLGGTVHRDLATDLLTINREFSVSLVLARCVSKGEARNRWKIHFDTSLKPDITVAVRLSPGNRTPLDYYLFPRLDFAGPDLSIAEKNTGEVESYRFDSLEYLHGMAAHTSIRKAA